MTAPILVDDAEAHIWKRLEEVAFVRGISIPDALAQLRAAAPPSPPLSPAELRAQEKRERKSRRRLVEEAKSKQRSVPWDLSQDPDPGETGIPARRTEEGRALGEQMARLCDIEEAKQLQRYPNQLPRCNDCAARRGTLPNEDVSTQMDLVKCIVEGIPFYCHKGIPQDGTPKRLCSGFVCLTSAGTEDLREVLARGRS